VADFELEMTRGELVDFVGTHKDAAGAIINITGWTIIATGRKKATAEDPPAFEKTCPVVSGVAGTYKIPFTPAQSNALPQLPADPYEHKYQVDVWRTDLGYEHVMGKGTIKVMTGVRHVV
jgi:hypothetical protein